MAECTCGFDGANPAASAGTNVEDSNAHSNVAKFGGDTCDSSLIISHVTLFTSE